MKLIETTGPHAKSAATLIDQIERRGATNTAKVEAVVATILADIRHGGDSAVEEYAGRFDHLKQPDGTLLPLQVTVEEMQLAWEQTTPELQLAMQTAQANIRAFAEKQKPGEWSTENTPGVTTGQIVRPLDSVGCYVPGGRYPLPSTLLMTVTPAQVAGVPRIVVCSPNPARETLAAAHLCGVTDFFRIGGAQAIAAMAFGTESIPRVVKIVGPGNLYVTAAKQAVSHECAIDMPAGPTEIGIFSQTGEPKGIAADLVAQAEHDPEALAVLITPSRVLADEVLHEVKLLSAHNEIAQQSLKTSGYLFVVATPEEGRALTNRLAFEHLSLDSNDDLAWVTSAGSIFLGPYAPQSMGDYISGPNHVLPTGRGGRFRGGLAVTDFLKVITTQHYTLPGLQTPRPPRHRPR